MLINSRYQNVNYNNCHLKRNIVFGNFNNAAKAAFENPEAKKLVLEGLRPCFKKDSPQAWDKFLSKIQDSPKSIRTFLVEEGLFPKVKDITERRANIRAEFMKYLLRDALKGISFNPKNMLDVGAGDGKVTKEFAEKLKVPFDKVEGLELYHDKKHDNLPFKMTVYNGDNILEAVKNKKYDAVSFIASLHHSKHPEKMINQASGILNPDGCLIIQEHNHLKKSEEMLHTFMDEFEYKVVEGLEDFQITHNYRTKDQWQNILENAGFKTLNIVDEGGDNPYKRFLGVFQKISNDKIADAYKSLTLTSLHKNTPTK